MMCSTLNINMLYGIMIFITDANMHIRKNEISTWQSSDI